MSEPVGPADALAAPRYTGLRTFARLPRLEDLARTDVAVLGAPFDSGASFRVGARFGPAAVRDASILLRPYHEPLDVDVFGSLQVADAGDAGPDPFDLERAHEQIRARAAELAAAGARVLGLGGDHSVALPLMRATAERHGPLGLIQLDAHSDTWGEYFGHEVTHGTFVRRAVEEGVIDPARSTQIGIRGPLYDRADLQQARDLGLAVVTAAELSERPLADVGAEARARLGDGPAYVSFDVDVLDPAFAPGTGTPEPGGLLSREAFALLRAQAGVRLAGADVVEVSPPYDQSGITASAGAAAAFELLALMALAPR